MLALALVASLLGDVGLKNAGTTIGPVTAIDCPADAGVFCARTTGTSVGKLSCAAASTSNTGCITPHDQVLAGKKTIDAGFVVMGATTLSGATINGNLLVDGGASIAGGLVVDGGVTVTSGMTAIQVTSRNGTYIGARGADGGLPNLTMVGTNAASLNTTGIVVAEGVSLPQTSSISGTAIGGLGTGGFRRLIGGKRFGASAQLNRLTGVIQRAGNGDGGLAADAGVTQTFFIEVYNETAGASLCFSALRSCSLSGSFSNACGFTADAGGFIAAYDDVWLTIHDTDCLNPPTINIDAEYLGLP